MSDVLEDRARRRAKALADVVWHTGAFVIVNAFLWTLDIVTGNGVEWAYWVTVSWGTGLAFHVLAWFVDGRDIEARAAERYRRELESDRHDEPGLTG